MEPATERKLSSLGCLTVLAGVCFFSYLTLASDWSYAAVVVGLMGGWLLFRKVQTRRDHRRHLDLLNAAFVFSAAPLPRLEEGSGYSFRAFRLTFSSEAELKHAESAGYIDAFKDSIQELYDDTGSRENPFDADRAVWATYEGWQPTYTTINVRNTGG